MMDVYFAAASSRGCNQVGVLCLLWPAYCVLRPDDIINIGRCDSELEILAVERKMYLDLMYYQ